MLLGAGAPPLGRLVPPDQWSRCLRSSNLPELHRTRSLPRSAEKKKASTGSYSLPCIKKKKAKSAGRKSPSPAAGRQSPTLKLLPARIRSRGGDSTDGRVKLKAKAWATPPRNRRKSQTLEVGKPPSLPPPPSPAPSTSSPTSSPLLAPFICGKRPPHIFSSPPSPLLASSHLSPRSNNQTIFSPTAGGAVSAKGESVRLPHIKRAEADEGTLGLLIQLCGLVRDISKEQKRQRGQKRTLSLPRITSSSLSFPQRAFIASPLAGRQPKNGRRSRLCNECLAKLYRHASEGEEVFLKQHFCRKYFSSNRRFLPVRWRPSECLIMKRADFSATRLTCQFSSSTFMNSRL